MFACIFYRGLVLFFWLQISSTDNLNYTYTLMIQFSIFAGYIADLYPATFTHYSRSFSTIRDIPKEIK